MVIVSDWQVLFFLQTLEKEKVFTDEELAEFERRHGEQRQEVCLALNYMLSCIFMWFSLLEQI